MAETRSDAELIARASRQPELFGVVFDRHFATIHRCLEQRVGGDGADELAGEGFRIAFERRRRFRPVHESAPRPGNRSRRLVRRDRRGAGDSTPPLVAAGYVAIDGESPTGYFWRFTPEGVHAFEALGLAADDE